MIASTAGRGRRSRAILAVAALVIPAGNARSDDPVDPRRLELGGLPAIAYDSDTGLGFGAIATLARFDPAHAPYRWRLMAQLYMTARRARDGSIEFPYHDDYLQLDLPGERLRLALRLAFGRFLTTGYYGLGQAAAIDDARAMIPHAYEYDRIYPEIQASARLPLSRRRGQLDLVLGTRASWNVINLYRDSKLAEDAARGLVVGADRHLLLGASVGILWDTRDHESAPTSGMLHEATLRAGAGLGSSFGYGALSLGARIFAPVVGDRLVLALRGMVDALFGRPPVYELAIGGATTVRGVRGQRYHGKIKMVGNLELRSRILRFTVAQQRFILGALAFTDLGRVLTDYDDPGGGGVALGIGGGLRLQWGEHFLVRVDLGYSPGDGSTGLYIDAMHIF